MNRFSLLYWDAPASAWRVGFAGMTLAEARAEYSWCMSNDPCGRYRIRLGAAS